ncbi:hypothetical protein WICPIJ_001480 [Wickerhamomyces pijperi]|uniref:Velvet domain-containing protein n=1 Tax=Wickerhamomyces pijperi TaxID=599730 RepID=A0A9P8QAT8_WICPI|nr:hypothetical protein WICPIJ_001480 [Wickerhamomyces pijperi]
MPPTNNKSSIYFLIENNQQLTQQTDINETNTGLVTDSTSDGTPENGNENELKLGVVNPEVVHSTEVHQEAKQEQKQEEEEDAEDIEPEEEEDAEDDVNYEDMEEDHGESDCDKYVIKRLRNLYNGSNMYQHSINFPSSGSMKDKKTQILKRPKHTKFYADIIQQPEHAKVTPLRFNEKTSLPFSSTEHRPIHPPPILQLRLKVKKRMPKSKSKSKTKAKKEKKSQRPDRAAILKNIQPSSDDPDDLTETETKLVEELQKNAIPTWCHYSTFFCLVKLIDEDGIEINDLLIGSKISSGMSVPLKVGSTAVSGSASYLEKSSDFTVIFAFPNLSVKKTGIFKLKFQLYEIFQKRIVQRHQTVSLPFSVHTPKKFPGSVISTQLTNYLLKNGAKIRKRRKGSNRVNFRNKLTTSEKTSKADNTPPPFKSQSMFVSKSSQDYTEKSPRSQSMPTLPVTHFINPSAEVTPTGLVPSSLANVYHNGNFRMPISHSNSYNSTTTTSTTSSSSSLVANPHFAAYQHQKLRIERLPSFNHFRTLGVDSSDIKPEDIIPQRVGAPQSIQDYQLNVIPERSSMAYNLDHEASGPQRVRHNSWFIGSDPLSTKDGIPQANQRFSAAPTPPQQQQQQQVTNKLPSLSQGYYQRENTNSVSSSKGNEHGGVTSMATKNLSMHQNYSQHQFPPPHLQQQQQQQQQLNQHQSQNQHSYSSNSASPLPYIHGQLPTHQVYSNKLHQNQNHNNNRHR